MAGRQHPVPSINDLRIKLCYICREEEQFDDPPNPPRRWVHPCKCTLIAHEECLLEWIRTSETSQDRSPTNFLKCPQCGTRYGIESNNPFTLRAMDIVSDAVGLGSHVATLMTLGAVVASVGTGVYILLSGYGAFAMQQFVGEEMYKLLLTDDPTNWPLQSFLALPLIPISLVSSQTKRYRNLIPLATFFFTWPSIPPVVKPSSSRRSFLPFFSSFKNTPEVFNSIHELERATVKDIFFSWPPSPFMLNIIFALTRGYYRKYHLRLRKWVLGKDADAENEVEGARGGDEQGGALNNWEFDIRIEDEGAPDPVPQAQVANQAAQAGAAPEPEAPIQDENPVHLVLDVQDVQNAEAQGNDGHEQAQPPAANVAPPRVEVVAAAANNQPANNGADRPNRLRLTGGKIGRVLGGALLIPTVSSIMGSLLLRLALPFGPYSHIRVGIDPPPSGFSPRYILQRFLAIKPPRSAVAGPYVFLKTPSMPDMSLVEMIRYSVAVMNRCMFVGTPAWTSADPVWWRNAVGLGLWFVAKDCVSLWHDWLSQREIKTRRVKDKSFEGIDPTELDLKPSAKAIFTQ